MYTVCTWRLAQVLDVPALLLIPRVSIYVALAAWMLAAAGLIGNLLGGRGKFRGAAAGLP